MVPFRVYGYPRSGNHFLMRMLWLTFFQDDVPDYRDLWGAHFSPEMEAPNPEGESIFIVRNPHEVMTSIWRMRRWFGIVWPGSYMEFLERPFRLSYKPILQIEIPCNINDLKKITGHDPCFQHVDLTPLEHHYRYRSSTHGTMEIPYEHLKTRPFEYISQIARRFGLPQKRVIFPEKVGYNV